MLAAGHTATRQCSHNPVLLQARHEQARGIKVSVYTESDLSSLASKEPFDIVCDATVSEGKLSFTFVCRQDFVSQL